MDLKSSCRSQRLGEVNVCQVCDADQGSPDCSSLFRVSCSCLCDHCALPACDAFVWSCASLCDLGQLVWSVWWVSWRAGRWGPSSTIGRQPPPVPIGSRRHPPTPPRPPHLDNDHCKANTSKTTPGTTKTFVPLQNYGIRDECSTADITDTLRC